MTPEQKAQLEELGIGQGEMVEMDRSQAFSISEGDEGDEDGEGEGEEDAIIRLFG